MSIYFINVFSNCHYSAVYQDSFGAHQGGYSVGFFQHYVQFVLLVSDSILHLHVAEVLH